MPNRIRTCATVLALLLPALCAVAQGDWIAYTDPAGRFSLQHPPGWTVVSETGPPDAHSFAFSREPIHAVSDDIEYGLSLSLVRNTQPDVLNEANLPAIGDGLRDQLTGQFQAQGQVSQWAQGGNGTWGGRAVRMYRGQLSQGNKRSELEMLVAVAPKWLVVAAFAWPQGEMDATLARMRAGFLFTQQSAPAAAPDYVVFVRRNPGENAGSELYLLDPGSGNTAPLTNFNDGATEPVEVAYPAWSPDRSHIVFASTFNAEHSAYPMNIFTVGPDGTDLTQLTLSPEDMRLDAGGPTGTVAGKVTLNGQALPGVRITAGGTRATTVTDARGQFRLEGVRAGENWLKAWAPERDSKTWGFDGENPSTLVWVKIKPNETTGPVDILLSNSAGSFLSRTFLTEPSWTADGKGILFVRRTHYTTMSGRPHLMTMNDPEWLRTRGYTDPQKTNPWLPKAEFTGGVAVILWQSQLMGIGADGQGLELLSPVLFSDGAFPRQLPDGSAVLFKNWPFDTDHAGTDSPFAFQGDAQVMAMTEGKDGPEYGVAPMRCERHSGLAVSPDGGTIAYVKFGLADRTDPNIPKALMQNPQLGTGWGPLAVFDLAAHTETVLTDFRAPQLYLSDLDFSPDGEWIIFCAQTEGRVPGDYYREAPKKGDLYAVNLKTKQLVQATNDGLSFMPGWRQ